MNELRQSTVLSARDIELIEAFANGNGKAARAPAGFAKLVEQGTLGIASVVLGFIDHMQGPIPLGTLYVVTSDEGRRECSVRGFDNSPVTPEEAYPTVASALIAAQPYFAHMARKIGQVARPTMLGRLMGILGR